MREGFLDRPLANEYADVLWSRLAAAWPRLTRRRRSYVLRLSHDVDFPLYRAPLREARGVARRDLRREHAPLLAARRVLNALVPALVPKSLDLNNTFDWVMRAGERLGLQSAFYFIAGRSAGPIDGSYEIDDPWILGLLARIHGRGHEIGFHASYNTFLDPERTRVEVEPAAPGLRGGGRRRPGPGRPAALPALAEPGGRGRTGRTPGSSTTPRWRSPTGWASGRARATSTLCSTCARARACGSGSVRSS